MKPTIEATQIATMTMTLFKVGQPVRDAKPKNQHQAVMRITDASGPILAFFARVGSDGAKIEIIGPPAAVHLSNSPQRAPIRWNLHSLPGVSSIRDK